MKNCVFTLTWLNFSHLQSTVHLMQYIYRDIFFHCSVFELVDFDAFRYFCHLFVTSLPHQYNVSLWGLFSSRETNKQKSSSGWTEWIGRVGHRGLAIFGQKLLNIQHSVGRCARKSPIMKWANTLKKSWKKFTETDCSLLQQCQMVHWYRRVPRTLT